MKKADKLKDEGKKQEAIEMYLRACAVYRIARFPYINSDVKKEAYEAQKNAYIKGTSLLDCPIKDVAIPHTAGTEKDEGKWPDGSFRWYIFHFYACRFLSPSLTFVGYRARAI